jgi:hypothetical protein
MRRVNIHPPTPIGQTDIARLAHILRIRTSKQQDGMYGSAVFAQYKVRNASKLDISTALTGTVK